MKNRIKLLSVLMAFLLILSGCSLFDKPAPEPVSPPQEPEKEPEIILGDAPLVLDNENDKPLSEDEPFWATPDDIEAPETPTEPVEPEEPETPAEPTLPEEDKLILVNPTHFIPEGFSPTLEAVQGDYKMSTLAAQSARDLIAGAKQAGFSLMVVSGYRTVETSKRLYENKVQALRNAGYSEENAKTEAARWVAPPGTSEHHTGLAMDVVSSDYFNYYADLEHEFENFDEFSWLYEHCADYGFILRFPKDKQDITGITYEPWHYRYVGIENAKKIMDEKICLEEYLGVS